jgi:hypothetical protein
MRLIKITPKPLIAEQILLAENKAKSNASKIKMPINDMTIAITTAK